MANRSAQEHPLLPCLGLSRSDRQRATPGSQGCRDSHVLHTHFFTDTTLPGTSIPGPNVTYQGIYMYHFPACAESNMTARAALTPMMIPLARRVLCHALSIATMPMLVPPTRAPAVWFATSWEQPEIGRYERRSVPNSRSDLSLEQALALIRMECDPAFIAAVRESGGQFLYRGETLPNTAALLAPPPDLLQLDTYSSRAAVNYFWQLERGLEAGHVPARPSSGHIAVARAEAAAQWGETVSVCACGASCQPM